MADFGVPAPLPARHGPASPPAEARSRPLPRGLALRAYLRFGAASAAETTGLPAADAAVRPDGPLIWFHLSGPAHRPATEELIRRLRYERRGTATLMTGPDDGLTDAPRSEAAAAAFLDHWRPEMIVLVGGEILPAVIDAAHRRGVPVLIVDAAQPVRGGWRWWPGVSRALMRRITRVLTQDPATLRSWRRLGAHAGQIEVAGRMEEGHSALPYTEAERDALARLLRARPVWLAMSLPEGEEAAALAAHREALGLRHRLLLVIVPEHPAAGPDLALRLEQEGWDVTVRSRDEEPGESDQVYIADTEGEHGLWYRLAPVTYFGGTLSGKGTPHHPYEAAALGSAILHGPKTGMLTPAYARLGKAGAARMLRGVVDFGATLTELLAPDRAAQMAHNAWEVTSSGAEVTDHMVQILIATLDQALPHGDGGRR